MKKIIGLLVFATCVTGCASGISEIAAMRGLNSSTVSAAEYEQHQRQRAEEVSEAVTQSTKTKAALETAKDTMGTIREGIRTINQLKGFFGW